MSMMPACLSARSGCRRALCSRVLASLVCPSMPKFTTILVSTPLTPPGARRRRSSPQRARARSGQPNNAVRTVLVVFSLFPCSSLFPIVATASPSPPLTDTARRRVPWICVHRRNPNPPSPLAYKWSRPQPPRAPSTTPTHPTSA